MVVVVCLLAVSWCSRGGRQHATSSNSKAGQAYSRAEVCRYPKTACTAFLEILRFLVGPRSTPLQRRDLRVPVPLSYALMILGAVCHPRRQAHRERAFKPRKNLVRRSQLLAASTAAAIFRWVLR